MSALFLFAPAITTHVMIHPALKRRERQQPIQGIIPLELAAKIFSMLSAVDFPGIPKVLERTADPPMTKEGHIAVKYVACCSLWWVNMEWGAVCKHRNECYQGYLLSLSRPSMAKH